MAHAPHLFRGFRLAALTVLGLLALAPVAHAQATTATLAWDANTEGDLAGYIVQYGTQAGNPTTNVDAGNVTSRQFSGLQIGVTYYFRVVAYNTSALQSGPSTEVPYTPAAPPPAPTLSSVSPTSGSTAGGTVLTLNGANFVSGATVRVGGTSATGVTFLSATQLRATTPVGTAGLKTVQVTNPDTQSVTLNNAFTYVLPAPTVTSVSPTSGTTAGGTTITITGTNFVSGATVRVGSTSATGVTFLSATQVRANTPAGSAGATSVQVTNPDTQSATLASAFTYVLSAPTVTSVSPTSGTTAGGTTITINGSNFVSGATVRVGGTSATGVTFLSATQVRANTPAGSAGATSVQVTNPDTQSATLASAFTYVLSAPTVTSVSPTSGTTAGGTTITINGTNFVSGATVRVGGTSATGVTFLSATQVRANTPAGTAGAKSVQVTNPDTQSATLASAFTYVAPAPTVTSVSPTSGTTAGGTTITINGTNFVSGATVRVGGTSATGVTFLSATQVRANTPAGTAGAKSVQVTNPDTQSATLASAFTYVTPAPTLTSVSPTSGTTLGGTTITLNGTNFISGATVRLGGASATGVTFVSATQLRANTPAGAAGVTNVQVTNPDTQSATLASAFTYVTPTAPAPSLTSVAPTSGPVAGGTLITLTGANFVSGATVRVDGASATGVTFVSASQLRATTPAGAVGPASVQVTNPDAQVATLNNVFTYVAAAPTISSVSPASGPTAGGTVLTIAGTGFVSGATVRVGATAATGVTFVSATEVRATTPARAAGAVAVQLVNPDTQSASRGNAFTYTNTTPTVTSVSPSSGPIAGGTLITISGTGFVPGSGAAVRVGGFPGTSLTYVSATTLRVRTPAGTTGVKPVQVDNPDSQSAQLANGFTYTDAEAGDRDGDGLPDAWETQFGTDPDVATGNDGATGDPDADGATNAAELAAGTHPRGVAKKYLAEGAVNAFFKTRLAIANPNTTEAKVLLTFVDDRGVTTRRFIPVPARSRRTVDASTVTELSGRSFATGLDSDLPVVMDRLMSWDGTSFGAHAETAVDSPATTWYLAEGATGGPFDLFYLIQNPSPAAATLTVRYLLPGGRAPIVKYYTVDAGSRFTIWVDQEDPGLASMDVSAEITSTNNVPVIVERSMYLTTWRGPWKGGHNSAAVTAPATRWFLAEGATGSFFSMYVLLANPGNQAASVRATFIRDSGAPVVRNYTVPANGRYTIDVAAQPGLKSGSMAVQVESTNAVPIIVERTMWWPNSGTGWTEGHNAFGTTTTGARWLLAEGELGGARGTSTFVLVANTGTADASVKVTVLYEDGAEESKIVTVGSRRRYTVDTASAFPAAANKRFSVLVESQNPTTAADLVVERAMYWNTRDEIWGAGSNAVATKLP